MQREANVISVLSSKFLLTIIKFYQKILSPVLSARCRYYPTCSEYGLTAIKWHGSKRGSLLTFKRICSCHPLGGHGIDFVPLPLYMYHFKPVTVLPVGATLENKQYLNQDISNVSCETLLVERGVYKDYSSYVARLNCQLMLT